MGAAELGIKWLSDECALGLFIALTVMMTDGLKRAGKIGAALTLF